jgi:DNA-directed RNA polymerase subunit RPC12/RpoP
MNCLKCDGDITGLVNYNTLCDDYITCPHCQNKMVVEYDESYDSESGDEQTYFWVENYKNDVNS